MLFFVGGFFFLSWIRIKSLPVPGPFDEPPFPPKPLRYIAESGWGVAIVLYYIVYLFMYLCVGFVMKEISYGDLVKDK